MHFNRDNWLGILNDHGGYLPVEIEAVPEGTVLPVKNVLVQVINTDPKYWRATSFFETALLRAVWYPTTVGTISWLSSSRSSRPCGRLLTTSRWCAAFFMITARAVSARRSRPRSADSRTW